MKEGSLQWFDGYFGQTHVIIDEFRAKCCPYNKLLGLLDGYQRQVPVKGSFTYWKPEVIYITAPLSPAETYAGQLEFHGSIDQLLRRITKIKNFEDEHQTTPPNSRIDQIIGQYNDVFNANIRRISERQPMFVQQQRKS